MCRLSFQTLNDKIMTITPIRGKANANIILDGSKSESNRALMIKYYGALSSEIDNLSHSADTMLLNNLLALVDKNMIVLLSLTVPMPVRY